MFESIVSSVLNQVLGSYVDNLDGSQLKLGIFSGNVVLKNLKLKKEAVDKLNLPIEIFEGHLGSLELKIPWANLKTQPVRVLIGDLYVLAGPSSEAEYDKDLEEKRIQQVKQEMLETAELFRSSSASKDNNSAENDSFVSALVTKIIDNLQIVIKNIHVRFEDNKSHHKNQFALGLTLSNLSAVSTDPNWVEAFIEDSKAPTHKLLKLDSLAVYWTPNSESLLNLPSTDFITKFKSLIHSENNENVELRYLIKPVTAIGKIIMRKKVESGEAKNLVNLEFDSFRIKLDDEQYYDVLMLAQNFIMSARNVQYRKYRPSIGLMPVDEPEIWFKYAVTCILEKIKARNKTRLWLNVIKRRQTRKKYVGLFKKKEVEGALSTEELGNFKMLEEILNFEDIKFYRSLARSEMKEEKLIPFALKQKQQQAQTQGSYNFISRWWSGSTKAGAIDDSLIKEDDIKKFYETIDYDENCKNEEKASPRDSKLLELSFDLKSGSISLAQTNPKAKDRKTILSLQFIDLIAHVIKRPDTLRAEVSLLDFSVIEKLTEFSIFPNLVRAKPSISLLSEAKEVENEDDEIARMALTAKEPFLSFVMDELPENSNADKSIRFIMKPLEIVLNHQAAQKIVDFVYGPKAKAALETLASAAETHITALANKTRASLENALEEHKALDLSVDIDAPVIYIPYDCEDPNAFLFIADLGHIEVRSRLVTASEKAEFSKKRGRTLTSEELNSLYTLMYDVLNVRLSRIKLSYAESLAQWGQLSSDLEFLPETNRIIDDIDVSVSVATCIVPKAINLAQKKIYAKLPAVQLIFSDEKYKKMMKLIEAISPEKVGEVEIPGNEIVFDSRNKSIFGDESTTRHSLSLSPQAGTSNLGETDDEFYDALESESANKSLLTVSSTEMEEYEAINIDLLIEIEEICAKLIRENVKYRKKDLLTLVAKKLKIACNVKPFNTVVNLVLEAFFIRDDMNFNGEEEVYLLSGLGGTASDSLLKVNVNLVDGAHPLFTSIYNSANIQVLLELAALNLFLNPATLIQTAEFFDTMFENEKDYEVVEPEVVGVKRTKSLGDNNTGKTLTLSRTASRKSEPKMSSRPEIKQNTGKESKSVNEKEGKKILLTSKLSELAVILGIGEDHFADLVLNSALAAICVEANGDINFSGNIADFIIAHRKEARNFEFLRIDGENALEVSYKKVKTDALVKFDTGALHFTYDALFIEDSCNFAVKLSKEAEILEAKKKEKEKKLRKAKKASKRLAMSFDMEAATLALETIAEESETVVVEEAEESDEEKSRLQFEINISSPVLDFPHPEGIEKMILSIFLGHIHSSNSFKAASDSHGNPLKSLGTQLIDQFINAKLEAMRIELRNEDEMFKLLDDVSLNVDISMIAKAIDRNYAETDVEGGIDVVRLKIAKKQLQKLLNLIVSLQTSLEKALKPLESIKKSAESKPTSSDVAAVQAPGKDKEYIVDEHNPMPTAVEVIFNIKSIELVLFEEWEIEPLARFALQDLTTNLIIQKDDSMILEQYITELCACDLRTKVQRKFKEIIISDENEGEDVKFKYEKTSQGDSIIKVEINAPKVVVSMDLINSILSVFEGLETGKKPQSISKIEGIKQVDKSMQPSHDFNHKSLLSIESEALSSEGSPDSIESEVVVASEPAKTFILAEVGQLQLYILEDPDSASSEAMQLSVQKITFAQQTNMSLSIDGVSAGFVNMDQILGVVQFIDPFDITATVELSATPNEKITQVWAIVKPVIIRFSYQDIQFFAKLSEQFSSKKLAEIEDHDIESVSSKSSAAKSQSSAEFSNEVSPVLSSLSSDQSPQAAPSVATIIAKIVEQVQVNLEGIRIVFIDDFTNVHIPLIDLAVDRISTEIRDWSSALKVNGILKVHANFFNRMNSHWEPIIEPWSLDLSLLTKPGEREKKMSEIILSSEKALEIIASHAFLDSLLSVTGKMAVAKPRAASAYREVAKPYLIRNYTGHVLSLWSDSKYSNGDGQAEVVEIPAGTELPFEFEDWKTFRSATKSKTHRISIHLMESPWESIKNISVDQQGLFVYPLRPKIQSTSHKIVCEVSVINGVRNVVLRSATCFKNNTSFDLEIADIAAERFTDSILIKSGGIGALPINFSAGGAFRIRPADNNNYKWSEEKFDLFDLFGGGKKTRKKALGIKCDPEDPETATPFFLDLQAQSDTPEEVIYASAAIAERASKKDVIDKFYGLGTIVLSPSLEIENLLPFDFGYRIYDHDGKYDFSGTLKAGGMNPLHGVDIKHVIGLSVDIDSHGLKTKQVAVINNGKGNNCDKLVQMVDANGIEASVFIDYDNSNKFAAKRVKIYSPYVILNQTGIPLEFKSSTAFIGSDQVAAGQGGRSADSTQPLLFSYPESNFVSGKDRIKIKADGSEWSKPISLDAVGNVNNFDVFNKETGTWYNFALYVHLGSDRFSKVHVVKLSPRYVIANRIPGRTLYVKAGDEPILQLKEGTINFHCNPSNFKNIRISYDGETWTPKFTIGDVGETYLKVFESVGPMGSSDESIKDSPMDLVKISNVLETQILYIAMTKEKKWPFKIVNKSSVEIKFNQKGCKNDRMLFPGETENFAWDDPSASQLALSVTVMERQRDYNIRELGQCKPLIYRGPGGEKSYLSVNVEADGPVILVKFKNYDVKASKGIFRLVRNSTQAIEEESEDEAYGDNLSVNNEAMSEASSNDFGVKEAKDETMMSFTLKLAGLGISLVGADLIEFLYVCGKGLEFRIQQSKLFQTLGFKLKWFQIDNCLFDYTHPILMYPAVVQKNEKELDEHPTLNIGIIKSNEGSGVDYYKYFGVLLQEMNIELGEELLEKIILFAQFDSIIPPPSPLLQDTDFQIPPLRNASVDTKLMYYELFQIHPIKLNVSFSRTESDSKSEGISAYNPLGPLLSILSMASGNISEAPLKFNSLLLEHPIVSSGTLKDRVIGHYTQQAIVQVHKILGSIDMLGNPVGLFNTMGEGVTDLFYEPYQGFVSDRPQDIGIGLAKGGFSFMRKTVSGLTGTFSKFTGSLGKGLAAATMDTSFQRNRRTNQARNKPTNAAIGVSAGAKSLYQGFASGISGIVEKPMEGARASGVGGFFKGVGVGLLGAVTKPLVGALDMTTSISEGVKNTAEGDSDEISQIRWPRVIPYDSIITAYSAREAYGQSLLAACIELNLSREKYFGHLEVPEDDCIVFMTTMRIMYVKRRNLQINWQVSFSQVLFCRPNFDTILLSVKQGEIRKRLIFCNDQGSQEWFCMKVDECLSIYNEKHRSIE